MDWSSKNEGVDQYAKLLAARDINGKIIQPVVRTGQFVYDIPHAIDPDYRPYNPIFRAYLYNQIGYGQAWYGLTADAATTVMLADGVFSAGALAVKGIGPTAEAGLSVAGGKVTTVGELASIEAMEAGSLSPATIRNLSGGAGTVEVAAGSGGTFEMTSAGPMGGGFGMTSARSASIGSDLAPRFAENPLAAGVQFEAQQLTELGLSGNPRPGLWRPTFEQTQSSAFKVIVGDARFTKGGIPVGTILDAVDPGGGLLEIKGGSSVLDSTYQLRLQTYRSLVESVPYTIRTTRPINPTFEDWLGRWGVQIRRVDTKSITRWI
jgi:hypothetical protein